jgi:hypothetical protein
MYSNFWAVYRPSSSSVDRTYSGFFMLECIRHLDQAYGA